MTPRCGAVLRRYGTEPEGRVCGKPEGHEGHHVSAAAWRRKLDGNKRRVQDWRERRRAA